MEVTQTYICTAKLRDKNDKIIAYNLRNVSTNQQQRVEPTVLKQFISSRNVNILNLQLTSDGRLIDREIDNPDEIIRNENFNKFINIIVAKYGNGKKHIEGIMTNPYKKYILKEIPLYNTVFNKATLSIEGTANPTEFKISFTTDSMEIDYTYPKQDWEASKLVIDKQIISKVPSMELETLLNRITSTFIENKGNVQSAVDCLGLCLVNSNNEVPLLQQQKDISILCNCYEIKKTAFYAELRARYTNYYKHKGYADTAVVLTKAVKNSLGDKVRYFSDRDVYDAYIAYLAITSSTEKSQKLTKIICGMLCNASILWLDTEMSKYRLQPEAGRAVKAVQEETQGAATQKQKASSNFVNFAIGSHAKSKTSDNKSHTTRNDLLKSILNRK